MKVQNSFKKINHTYAPNIHKKGFQNQCSFCIDKQNEVLGKTAEILPQHYNESLNGNTKPSMS